MKSVKTRSGINGWRMKLHSIYDNFEEFRCWDILYGISGRLGYKNTKNAWKYNPMVEGSVNPSDLRKVNV